MNRKLFHLLSTIALWPWAVRLLVVAVGVLLASMAVLAQTPRFAYVTNVDANPIISALIGGAAARVFAEPRIEELVTTEFTIGEVTKYLPRLAKKADVEEAILLLGLKLLPLKVYPQDFYSNRRKFNLISRSNLLF